ncbi:pre-mrna splicing factor rna helicase [Fusarium albosuccineum]|uniref:Pre-mrna splicing factor rna helicase n=1 Tax=Fusarium albosuccineum TaxID=1237068 RepID=A0A8H4LMV3_9HYPO|nr:pre-mrna splicing factor rna helicase [Fusarium albosuccineum]
MRDAPLRATGVGLKVIPLHSALGRSQHREAFGTYPQRKCIVSNNIAEASLTVGTDSGLEKQEGWNPRAGMETLQTAPISQASARQRADRAIRMKPGVCFRLYTEEIFNNAFLQNTPPGIAMEDLSSHVLHLMDMGFAQVAKFDFVTSPSLESFLRALQDLHDIYLINADGVITFAGRTATQIPTDPMWMNAFKEAQKLGCLSEMIAIAALLSTQNSIFRRPEQQRYAADAAHRHMSSVVFFANFSQVPRESYGAVQAYMSEIEGIIDGFNAARNTPTA